MTIAEVRDLVGATVQCGEDRLGAEVRTAFGADLMSDVLAFVQEDSLLLTGLVNTHVIRTAEMLDVRCVLFVRGKKATKEIIEMANEHNIVILTTPETLYVCSGILYGRGLPGLKRK